MKYLLTLIFCLALQCVQAEKIGFIEYQLPDIAKSWETKNFDSEKITSIAYLQGKADEESEEIFGVDAKAYPADIKDEEALKTAMQKQYPDARVTVKILEKNDDSIIFEWRVTFDEGQMYGLSRSMTTKEKSGFLGYMNFKPTDASVEQAHQIWLPALKNAKIQG